MENKEKEELIQTIEKTLKILSSIEKDLKEVEEDE